MFNIDVNEDTILLGIFFLLSADAGMMWCGGKDVLEGGKKSRRCCLQTFILFQFLNHAQINFYNQPVLNTIY